MKMDFKKLLEFIDSGIEAWEKVRQDLSLDKEAAAFLNKAYPVVMFDHYQLDLDMAKKLYIKTRYHKPEKSISEEVKRDKFRLKMLTHFEKSLKEVFFEIRFPYLNIELIEIVKAHHILRELNRTGRVFIRVIVKKCG